MIEEKDKLIVVQETADGLDRMLDKLQVTNEDELNIVNDRIRELGMLLDFLNREKDKFVAPAKAIILEARGKYDAYIKKCEGADKILRDRAKVYLLAQESQRKEQEARIAARVEKGTMRLDTAIKKIETLPDAPKTVRSDNNSVLTMSKRKVARIDNPELVPDEYWVIDEGRVKKEALSREKNGLPQIPGMIIVEEAILSSR